jgi:hypothetical protein
MRRHKQLARLTVDVIRGNVVLTVSPPRAHDIAMVIERSGPREEWLRETVRLMLTAADRLGIPSDLVPRLSRRQFLRDWDLDQTPAPASPPVTAGAQSVTPDLALPQTSTEMSAPYAQKQEVAASLVHAAAVHAAELAQEAVDSAADRAAEAASTARAQRSAAVEDAAEAVAARVAKAAAAVESEADEAALTVAQAAFDAAFLIASTVKPGSERDAALTATLVATAVSAIAIKTAAVTAAARADVAREAASAASAAAVAAADAAKIVDLEVMCAAEAVRAVASEAALTLAVQTDAQATAFALAHS